MSVPRFGPADNQRTICFNFCTDPHRKCDGQKPLKRVNGPTKPCGRLHIDLALATHRTTPKEHDFAEIHAWLKDPSVHKSFLPSDVFASSTQFQAL
jgi:hypothetical protein